MSDQPRLPTEQELKRLPRRALLALSARCARRVQPLFAIGMPEAPPEHAEALEASIRAAEAASCSSDVGVYDSLGVATAASAVGTHASEYAAGARAAASFAAGSGDTGAAAGLAFSASVRAAADAAHAASQAAFAAASHLSGNLDPGSVARVIGAAAAAAGAVNEQRFACAVAGDFRLLLGESKRLKWNDVTPVDPSVLGALWPNGQPDWWPRDHQAVRQELLIELVVPDDISGEDLDALVLKHALTADVLHAAAGGSGLKVDAIDVYEDVHVPQEVLR